jgi:hypothetical protein
LQACADLVEVAYDSVEASTDLVEAAIDLIRAGNRLITGKKGGREDRMERKGFALPAMAGLPGGLFTAARFFVDR